MVLEIVLAIMWWLHECKKTPELQPEYQELAKEQTSGGAIQHGVETLCLMGVMRASEFAARAWSRGSTGGGSNSETARDASSMRDLMRMQSHDPTMPIYKSGMAVKGFKLLQEWTK